MEEFGDHEASTRGNRAFFEWKDEREGKADVWLADDPRVLWRNPFSQLRRYKEEGTEKEVVGTYWWNTYEDSEELLKAIKRQGYSYDADPAKFDLRHKPKFDPFLKLMEWIYGEILHNRIDWCDEIFRFEPQDGDDKVVHAGGFLGQFPRSIDELEFDSEQDKRELQKKFKHAGIKLNEVFKESSKLACNYLFILIDDEHPEKGPQICTGAEALGNKIKKVYKDRKEKFDNKKRSKQEIAELANIVKRVCLRWKFDNSQQFDRKYDVIVLDHDPNDPERDDLREAFAMELPNVDPLVYPMNVAVLEKTFRAHWCHKLTPPWTEIFAAAYKEVAGTELAKLPEDFDPDDDEDEDDDSDESEEKDDEIDHRSIGAGGGDEKIACEKCGGMMPETALECPHCKAAYFEFEDGLVCLRDQKCEHCGETWNAGDLECKACGAKYKASDEGFAMTYKPEPKKSVQTEMPADEPRPSRRQQRRQASST